MQTEREVRAHILLKATKGGTEDEAFRARLLADPKGVVEGEAGITFPADFTFHIHEETATDAHMILPPSNQLSPQDLQAVALMLLLGRLGMVGLPKHRTYRPSRGGARRLGTITLIPSIVPLVNNVFSSPS